MVEEYFIDDYLLNWFEKPERPKPPLYVRKAGSGETPSYNSPIGKIFPHTKIIKLSSQQIKIWKQI